MNRHNNRQRLIALIGTLLFHAAIVAILLMTWLFPATLTDDEKKQWEQLDDSEILLAGEYVIAGDVTEQSAEAVDNVEAPGPTVEAVKDAVGGADRVTEGSQGDRVPIVSSRQPSPMQTTTSTVPRTPGVTKNESPEKKPRQEVSQETAKNISSRTGFGNRNNDKTDVSGRAGANDGTAASGAVSGMVGGQLAGRTVAKWAYPSSPVTGRISVRVTVDSTGKVTSAKYAGGSGAAAANGTVRTSCVQAALRSRFSVVEGSRPQSGTITYNIK